ncbi:MAG: type II toxin-antitoxin system HicA family toxin [Armatimonadetes bacterium]|nr:type II toxin-antitoxin system HicA family toxin [Armatimonadota bacterium]
MKRSELIRHLEDNGCSFYKEGGKHSIYKKGKKTVPRRRKIDRFLAEKICKQLGVPKPTSR